MLVCNVSQLARRAAIAAGIVETTAALDAPGTGNVVFATLVIDPASVLDRVDAYFGSIMLETANASATVNAGLLNNAAIVETATTISTQDATTTPATTGPKTIDGTAGGQFSVGINGNISLTTTLPNDVIILMYFHEFSSAQTIATVTSPHLTWTKRRNYPVTLGGFPSSLEIWWRPQAGC